MNLLSREILRARELCEDCLPKSKAPGSVPVKWFGVDWIIHSAHHSPYTRSKTAKASDSFLSLLFCHACILFLIQYVDNGGFQKTVCWGVSLGCFSFYNATPLIPFWGLSLAKVTGIRNHWDLGWMFEDELKCQGKYLASQDKVITQKWSVLLFAALAREFHWYWSLAGKVGK